MMRLRVLQVNDLAGVASNLTAALRALGHDAVLRRLRLVGGTAPTAVKIGLLPVRLAELLDVDRQIRTGGFDLVHFHYAYLGALGALGRHRYVLHCHGSDVRPGLRDPLRRPLILAALRGARAVFVSTPDLLPIVRAVRPDTRFLPNPIDTDLFRPGSERTPGAARVLLISSTQSIKGFDVAARAARALQESGIVVHAIVRNTEDERRYRELGIRDLIPAVPHERMPDLINAHDIVVGQRSGGLGLSELEGLACARPVLSEWRYPDAYPDPPPVITARDEADIFAALDRLVKDEAARAAQGALGRAWIMRHHERLRVARQLADVYQELIA